ncbi:MAG: peptidoglycan DD-metalloendopeptidase family protein [Anaerolineae bacterium]|nr:peptidoglycan DD-metalloendopeptidase family protein [Anaerolineae bacterium]
MINSYRRLQNMVILPFQKLIRDDALLRRVSTHLIVILLVVVAVGLSNIHFSTSNAVRSFKQEAVVEEPVVAPVTAEESAPLTLPASLNSVEDDVLVRAVVPHTIIPDRTKEEITTYVVEFGDTVFDIAFRYGLAPETIMWSNPSLGDNPDLLRVGQELTILPVDGVYHQVGGDDTLEGIAATYKVEPAAIIDYFLNELDPDEPIIQPGQWLVVPGGTKPYVPRTVTAYSGPVPEDATKGTGIFGWPASGSITQGYWGGHRGLDIGGWLGAPITASDSGHVIATGWDDTGYGYVVVIDHGNGFQTLYAHLQAYYVEAGDDVAKGQTIAEMGSTGNSTGPHLHFEIRQGTVQRNPYGFLP